MKKTILIDVDDVICENHFFYLVNSFLKKINQPELKTLDGFKTPDFEREVFKTNLQAFYDYYLSKDSYKKAKSIEYASFALEVLMKDNDVYMVTSCIHDEREIEFARQYVDKFKWILRTFPFFPPKHIIMSNKKFLFRADVIIDDRLKNLKGDYKTKILFTSFHNKHITDEELKEAGAVRANGWQEVLKILKYKV